MQKKIIGAACALSGAMCAIPALAQSQVSAYGILDTGVAYTNNVNSAGDSQVKMPGLTGSVPSRFGFRGSEDLGGALEAVFVLEGGFGVDTGASGQGARLFGRQASVGLRGRHGTLTLGRQVNMTYLAALQSDVLGPNLFSMSAIDPYIPNARSDNAIGYLGTYSDFTYGVTYSFGRDASAAGGAAGTACPGEVAGNAKACRQVTGLLGYDNKAYGLTTSYDIMYGNAGAAAGLTTSDSRDKRVTLNGYAMVGEVRLGAGAMARRKVAASAANNFSSDLYYVGARYVPTPSLQFDAQVARLNVKDSPNDSTMAVLRATYILSKRTALHGSVGHMKNAAAAAIALDVGGTVGAGKNQSGIVLGLRHMF